ncbi:uncharacterized protein LOC132196671 [Neocloeon triangulifer]|uniref:uncharacterized protein LOC132196671 n=1 Tax=Neocloeon triangulifer TaxID=2078957 RepID=UPI00286F2E25|nr:uncharacterized protein LOC132196671 [Neocloeon triangulifer]
MELRTAIFLQTLLLGLASSTLLPRTAEISLADARQEVLTSVSGLWAHLKLKSDSDPMNEILRGFNAVDEKLSTVHTMLSSESPGTGLFLGNMWSWGKTLAAVQTTDSLYETVRTAFKDRRNLQEASAAVVNPRDESKSVTSALERLHDASVGTEGDEGLFQNVVTAVTKDSSNKVCGLEQSPQQLVFNLYNLAALTELKGYAILQFSWMTLQQLENGSFVGEAEVMRAKTEKRSGEKARVAREAMRKASRQVWRCDPKKHEENVTFIQLTELLQGYVQNEVDLNSKASCGENCAYYTYAKVHGCYHNQYCSKQRKCNGRVFSCQYIDADSWVCPSDQPNRRYDYIEYENGRVLGRPGFCTRGTTKVDSWWRWLFWHCSYCFCTCDDDGPNSDRYFSLRSALSNYTAGYAVVGMRFVKLNRVIHLQVQQAKVTPRGGVDVASAEWVAVEAFDVAATAPGRDYHKMDYEQRAIDLDDLVAPPGYVLTGIRFRRIGTHLNAEILASPMDMEAGTLNADASLWIGNDNTDASIDNPRTGVPLVTPDIPTRTSLPSETDSSSDQFVTFTHSDMSKDAAQTTVPFLDAQSVQTDPPILLSGAGVYHKGRRGFGGFVGLRLITYDFSDLLGVNDTDMNLNK